MCENIQRILSNEELGVAVLVGWPALVLRDFPEDFQVTVMVSVTWSVSKETDGTNGSLSRHRPSYMEMYYKIKKEYFEWGKDG